MLDERFLAKVTAYKGFLLIEAVPLDFKHPSWVPAGNGKIGCMVLDAEPLLGVSEEALALLKTIKKSRDAIGDVMWGRSDDQKLYFGWLGGNLRLVDPTSAEGDRDYDVQAHTSIPNDVPEAAKAVIDKREDL